MKLNFRHYLTYKLVNSLFTGLVGGSIFTIYAQISPSVFSLGGIALALGLWGMALYYHRLMSEKRFFAISIFVEGVMFAMVGYFLLWSEYQHTALIVYIAYQLSFMMGGYIVRAESFFGKKGRLLGWIDAKKQQGYIAGLALSYLFYQLLENGGITAASQQVYYLHEVLFVLQGVVIFALWRAFVPRQAHLRQK